MNTEYDIYVALSDYLKVKYPKVMFNFDMSGLFLQNNYGLIKKNNRIKCDGVAMPDLFIMKSNKEYNGLFIEIKKEGGSPYKNNGHLRKTYFSGDQVNQKNTLNVLNEEGYYACFCTGFDKCVELIDWYLEFRYEICFTCLIINIY